MHCIHHSRTLENGQKNQNKKTEVKAKSKGKLLEHVKVAFNQKIRKGWRVHNVAQEERLEERVSCNARSRHIDGLGMLCSEKDNPTSRKF
jgi:hypothetical protein